jgi:hypothetical protein
MTKKYECGDHEALVTYLYDESTPAERVGVEAHLAICPACAAELGALASTSMQLASWTPPDADLTFKLVSEPRTQKVVIPAPWWQQPLPAWAQAMAALVVFGVGISLGVATRGVTTGPATAPGTVASARAAAPAPAPTAAPAQLVAQGGQPAATRADLQELERRLLAELTQVRTVASQASTVAAQAASAPRVAAAAGAPAAGASDAQLLARVRALIDESEQRQRRELALRTAELVRDVDAQRQFDFARIQRAFGQFEGTAGIEIQRQRQDLNNLIRVAQRPQ